MNAANTGHGNARSYAAATADFGDAHVRPQCRHLATVVAIGGAVDAANVAAVSHHTRRYVLADKPLILDLSRLESVTPQAIALLRDIDSECRDADVEWALVPSSAVTQQLLSSGDAGSFPTAGSVADALQRFADDIHSRRSRLLPMFARTA